MGSQLRHLSKNNNDHYYLYWKIVYDGRNNHLSNDDWVDRSCKKTVQLPPHTIASMNYAIVVCRCVGGSNCSIVEATFLQEYDESYDTLLKYDSVEILVKSSV